MNPVTVSLDENKTVDTPTHHLKVSKCKGPIEKKEKKLYNNTESRRKSSRREHISIAGIIGLANLYDIDLTIQIPTTKEKDDTITLPHLIVLSSSISSNEINHNSQINQNIQNKIPIENDRTKVFQLYETEECKETMKENQSKSRSKCRNENKTEEANQINKIFHHILHLDPQLTYNETKKRPSKKTIKLLKFNWISPFNEEGFAYFAEGIIEILYTL